MENKEPVLIRPRRQFQLIESPNKPESRRKSLREAVAELRELAEQNKPDQPNKPEDLPPAA